MLFEDPFGLQLWWSESFSQYGHQLASPLFTAVLIDILYLVPVCIFTVPYLLSNLNVFATRKIQCNRRPDLELWCDSVKKYFVTHGLIRMVVYPLAYFCPFQFPITAELPHIVTLMWEVGKIVLINDFGLYWQHYLMHNKYMYKRFHYVHHMYRYPFPIVAEIHHWVDDISLIAITVTSTYLAGPTHVVSIWIAYAILQWHAVENHCGYDFGFQKFFRNVLCFAPVHDAHHLKVVGNYGTLLSVWDRLFGTYIGWTEPKQSVD